MASRFQLPFADVGSGISPSDGAKLEFFISGTNTQKDTFSDEALITKNANPVIANGNGVFPDIFLPDGGRYKVTLDDKNIVQKFEADPVIAGVSAALSSKTFDTVAAMVASTELNIGDIIETAGYLSKGNGGDNRYEIVAAATGTVDGGSFIDLTGFTGQAKGLFPEGKINVRQFGATGDGVADDTVEIQAACNFGNSKGGAKIDFPKGTYFLSATITIFNNVELVGSGGDGCLLKRTGSYGDTIKQTGGFCKINGFFFLHGTFPIVTDVALDFKLTDDSAHIRLVDTQDAEITSNTIFRMPHAIVNDGGINSKITSNFMRGVWDRTLVAMQEGLSDISYIGTSRIGQLSKVKNNYFSGTPGPVRNTTYSDGVTNVVKNIVSNIGSQFLISAAIIEDLEISGNFFGRASFSLVRLLPAGILNNVRIAQNFFDNSGDGADGNQILVGSSVSGQQVLGLSITGNTFNGEVDTNSGINIVQSVAPLLASATNVQITGNSFFAHTKTPIILLGVRECTVNSNSLQNYNAVQAALVTSTNETVKSAVFIGGISAFVSVTGNVIGGGGNDASNTSNFCYSGVTLDLIAAPENSSRNNVYSGLTDDVNFFKGVTTEEVQFVHTVEANFAMTQWHNLYIRKFVATAANLIQLPPSPVSGREVTIKDGQGDAGTFDLIINTADGTTIDGGTGPTINTNFGFMRFRFNDTEWNRIG